MTYEPVKMSDRELIAALEDFRRQEFLSRADVATMANMSETTLSQIIAGKYEGDTAKYMSQLRAWLVPYIRPGSIDVIHTETFQSLIGYYTDAYNTHSLYCIVGKSGFGKTVSGRYYSRIRLRAHWVSGRVNMGPKNMLEELVRAMKLRRTARGWNTFELQNAIVEHLRSNSSLVIVDEADKLNVKALDALREIYDAVSVGLVLIGEPALESKLKTPDRNSGMSLARLFSRVDEFVEVDEITKGDVRMFLKANGIESIAADAFDYIVKSVNNLGGYRRLAKMTARLRAAGSTRALTREAVVDVLSRYPSWT